MNCPKCNAQIVQPARFCHLCGEGLPEGTEEAQLSPAAQMRQAAARIGGGPAGDEAELWSGTYSPKAMIGAWITAGVISCAAIVGWIVWMPPGIWWLGLVGILFVVWGYSALMLLYRRLSVRYQLTSRRFIHQRGLLRRLTDRIEVIDIDDITVEQGFIERLLGVGSIRITSSDRTHPELRLPGIENVQEVAAVFDNARLAERRRRSLHLEQI